MIQHPTPTIDEGICHIEKLPLGPNDKSTLITTIMNGFESWRGDALFLPSINGETEVETLEREIQRLEVQIAGLR